jgi:hypothetical protein
MSRRIYWRSMGSMGPGALGSAYGVLWPLAEFDLHLRPKLDCRDRSIRLLSAIYCSATEISNPPLCGEIA